MFIRMTVQIRALAEASNDYIPLLSNASALLNENLENINWCGFYLVKNNALQLGPFQGKIARVNIEKGKGVCGTAYERDEVIVVKDVHQFPGHIACDAASNSEIVIPIHRDGEVVAVLDIDSPITDRFDEKDRDGLVSFVKVLEDLINWD
ncbi:MAG: GAF domain-containing protein [Erysipelotrichaceae bacterium]|nr:GAF domain-containing protein [Erysipelotrichaceae bacterium]